MAARLGRGWNASLPCLGTLRVCFFCGDEMKSDQRSSFQPRAVLSGGMSLAETGWEGKEKGGRMGLD